MGRLLLLLSSLKARVFSFSFFPRGRREKVEVAAVSEWDKKFHYAFSSFFSIPAFFFPPPLDVEEEEEGERRRLRLASRSNKTEAAAAAKVEMENRHEIRQCLRRKQTGK